MLDLKNLLTQWVTQHNLGNALFCELGNKPPIPAYPTCELGNKPPIPAYPTCELGNKPPIPAYPVASASFASSVVNLSF